MARVMINLKEDERQALVTLAEVERRDPRDQAAMLIRESLIERGYIVDAQKRKQAQTQTGASPACPTT